MGSEDERCLEEILKMEKKYICNSEADLKDQSFIAGSSGCHCLG